MLHPTTPAFSSARPGGRPARLALSRVLVRAACVLLAVANALLDPALDDAYDCDVSLELDRLLILRELCRC